MSDPTMKFQLVLEQKDASSPQLSAKVQLSQETIKEMGEKGVQHAFLLLITAEWNEDYKHYFHERRQLFRLEESIAFLSFTHPGTFHVFGVVLFSKRTDGMQVFNDYYRRFTDQNYEGYRTTILQRGKFEPDIQDFPTKKLVGHIAHESVMVTEDFFAKPPTEWVVKWIDWPYNTESRDSCQLKRRSMFAFTLQPPIVLVVGSVTLAAYSMIAAFWLLLLQRVVLSGDDVRASKDWDTNSFLLTDSRGRSRTWVSWPQQLLLTPMTYLGATIIGHLFLEMMNISWWSPSASMIAFLSGAFTVLSIYVLGQITQWILNAFKWRKKPTPQQLPRNYADIISQLANRPLRLRDMPMSWATVTLCYQAAKHKLCRPYAR